MANYRQTSASAAPSTRYARTCFVSPRGPRARAKELTEPCPGDEAPAVLAGASSLNSGPCRPNSLLASQAGQLSDGCGEALSYRVVLVLRYAELPPTMKSRAHLLAT